VRHRVASKPPTNTDTKKRDILLQIPLFIIITRISNLTSDCWVREWHCCCSFPKGCHLQASPHTTQAPIAPLRPESAVTTLLAMMLSVKIRIQKYPVDHGALTAKCFGKDMMNVPFLLPLLWLFSSSDICFPIPEGLAAYIAL